MDVRQYLIEWYENYELGGDPAVVKNYRPSWISESCLEELSKEYVLSAMLYSIIDFSNRKFLLNRFKADKRAAETSGLKGDRIQVPAWLHYERAYYKLKNLWPPEDTNDPGVRCLLT